MNADRIEIDKKQFSKALDRLAEAIAESSSDNPLWLDGTIQRFEFCYELAWKTLKRILAEKGIEVGNPLDTFKKAYAQGWIDQEHIWVEMKDDRNLTVHTYKEELAIKIYARIKDNYYSQLRALEARLKNI